MTFLFDPQKGLEALYALENQWGGTAQQRLDARYAAYAAQAGEAELAGAAGAGRRASERARQ